MGLLKDYEYIVRDAKGKIYNFYLNEKKQIEYIVTNEKKQWAKKDVLLEETITSFSIDIDEKDHIHIVSFSEKGILFYHSFKDHQWRHQKIVDYPHGAATVYYPIIKKSQDKLHLFYYRLQKDKPDFCSFVHLVNHQERWTKDDVFDSSYKKFVNPFKTFYDEQNIYVLYTTMKENQNYICLASYNKDDGQWGEPLEITQSPIDIVYLYGLMDPKGTFHITWSIHEEEGLRVQYCKHSLVNTNDTPNKSEVLSLSEKLNCSFPSLILCNNVLWCVWVQMNKLYGCHSLDQGDHWSPSIIRNESQGVNFKRYYYRSNFREDTSKIICDFLYGTLYPKIQFIGFGGEMK